MSNNLNQLAKRANEAGFKVVKWEMENLAINLKSLYLKLSDDWKHQ
ncbi:bacterial mobilization family protein [Parabacteroides distasonis str. 3776 D15 iv]|nr:bacterial mobilization family protein [Parabacteroides distasonis str. 3776 Po2 i]KDS70695.1 bacterial mobilization family protein [Parabacteroides distasonis str. 3776 D15 iv]